MSLPTTLQWLIESLPNQILFPIATFIASSNERCYERALQFAEGSEERRRAVLEAFEFRVVFREEERALFQDLIRLFGDTIQSISLMEVADDLFLYYIPYLPSLRSASIVAREKQLTFIKDSANLTTLELKVPSKEVQEMLASSCRNVTKLDLRGHNVCYKYLYMVKSLESLRIISYSGSARLNAHLDTFAKLDEVHLCHERIMRQAEYIGPAMRTLYMARVQNSDSLSRLYRCTKLKALLVAVEDGAERALLGITGSLESLDLRWGYPHNWDSNHGTIRDEEIYYEPDSDVILSLVRGSTKLRHLLLERALIPISLVEDMLQITGERLEQFGVHMTGQDEYVAIRMEMVLAAVARNCPNIKCLLFMGMNMTIRAKCEDKDRCRLALSKARNRCPKLNTDKIRSQIDKIRPLARDEPIAFCRGWKYPHVQHW